MLTLWAKLVGWRQLFPKVRRIFNYDAKDCPAVRYGPCKSARRNNSFWHSTGLLHLRHAAVSRLRHDPSFPLSAAAAAKTCADGVHGALESPLSISLCLLQQYGTVLLIVLCCTSKNPVRFRFVSRHLNARLRSMRLFCRLAKRQYRHLASYLTYVSPAASFAFPRSPPGRLCCRHRDLRPSVV
jgi:hypothetical protein